MSDENTPMSSNEVAEAFEEQKAVESGVPEQSLEDSQPKEDKFSSKFAALSRREKQLRELQRQIKSERDEFDRLRQEREQEFSKYKELPNRIKQNPLEFLQEYGVSYEDITNLALNDGKPTTAMELKRMREEILNELNAEKEERAKLEKRLEEEKYQSVINNYMNEIEDYINKNEQYELIRANSNEGISTVYDVIKEHYERTLEETGKGEVMSTEDAANLVEEYLEQEAQKFLSIKKLGFTKAQIEEAQKQEAVKSAQEPEKKSEKREGSFTLSNDHNFTSSGEEIKPEGLLSKEESLRRLQKKFEEQLKNNY